MCGNVSRVQLLAIVAASGALIAHVLHGLFGLNGGVLGPLFDTWLYNAIILTASGLCLARALLPGVDRRPWAVFGVALLAWSAGEITYSVLEPAGAPSVSDVFFLAYYPLIYAGVILLLRSRDRSLGPRVWLDGAIAGLAAATLGAAVLFEVVLDSTGGKTAEIIVNLAYPLGDILLFALVVTVFALRGWRASALWTLIGASMLLNAVADGVYLFQATSGTYLEGTVLDSLWPASALALALASLQRPESRQERVSVGRGELILPAALALIALAALVYDHAVRLNALAIALATGTLLAVVLRTVLAFRENIRILESNRRQAVTDALTGLQNRRSLLSELEAAFERDGNVEPSLLLLFDLDGFKIYNDTYGHPAGDALLTRLGHKLNAAVAGRGSAFRLGGDEFCVIADGAPEGAESLIAATSAALSERGEAFSVGVSFGAVFLPEEAANPAEALRLADTRLYSNKQGKRSRRGRRPEDLLLRAMYEREPALLERTTAVTELAAQIGSLLALSERDASDLARAAELHDIGKLAIPDAILNKLGPLTDEETAFVRSHSSIGERILSASGELAGVAGIVRSTSERWDGTGYPDGLVGNEIPLAARIIAVCTAFAAMISPRPYRPGRSVEEALAEIRLHAGTQFDPEIVRLFLEVASLPAVMPRPVAVSP